MMISLEVLETIMLLLNATTWELGLRRNVRKILAVCTRMAFHDSRELE